MVPENEYQPGEGPNQDYNNQDRYDESGIPADSGFIDPVQSNIPDPKPYSIRIHVTANQQANARLLTNIIHEEGKSQPMQRPARFSSLRLLYIGIGLVLILAISWPFAFGSPDATVTNIPPEVRDFQQRLLTLPENSPVLIGFDYEPGFSGELDVASSAVLRQLFARGVYPVVIASTPTGVIQAERVISKVESSLSTDLDPVIDYVNLGYIPGGPISLGSLALSLRSTVPYDMFGYPVWDNPALTNIDTVADFSGVLIITSSADTGRDWIEQISPVLNGTPMLMVVSEQVAPMIKPYYLSRPDQVQGLLIGLYGAASFENISGSTDIATSMWNAFSFGVLALTAIILTGGLVSAVSAASRPLDS